MAYTALMPLNKLSKAGNRDYVEYPFNPTNRFKHEYLDILFKKMKDDTLYKDYSKTLKQLVEYYQAITTNGTIAGQIIKWSKCDGYVRTSTSFNILLKDILKVTTAYSMYNVNNTDVNEINFRKYEYIKTIDASPNINNLTKDLDITIPKTPFMSAIKNPLQEFILLLEVLGIEEMIYLFDLLRFVQIVGTYSR